MLKDGRRDEAVVTTVLIGDGPHWIWEESQHICLVTKAVWPQDDTVQHVWVDDVWHRLRHEGGGILEAV